MAKMVNPKRFVEAKRRLARRRVWRGARWLFQNAPFGWQWNMFSLCEDKTVWYRANDSYDNECVLALAFTERGDLANKSGYVTFASVAKHFNLDGNFLRSHAFDEDENENFVDQEWEAALTTYARPRMTTIRHLPSYRLVDAEPNDRSGRLLRMIGIGRQK